ncbi:Putative ribonuclease H protein At1g65750 [Linum grandiflorum]
MDKNLAGWKAASLALAGRVTLAQSVLSAIPSYIMQTFVFPSTICSEIDKWIHNFVWGTTIEERKIHLVSWEQICQPKNQGGLGLRMDRQLNSAYMVKLGYLFLTKPNELWVQVLRTKYRREDATGFHPRHSFSKSPLLGQGDDLLVSGPEIYGQFKVQSAYDLLGVDREQLVAVDWRIFWRWRGPCLIRHFLWLAVHNKLLANNERRRQHMTKANWDSPLLSWITHHLKTTNKNLVFGVACWSLWKTRNEFFFTDTRTRLCHSV